MPTIGCLSDWAENRFIDLTMGGVAWTSPATVYLALCTAASDVSATETTYTNYARQPITFGAPSGRAITQGATVVFPTVGVTGDTITHYAIYDAVSGGNYLGWGALSAPKTLINTDPPEMPSGSIVLTVAAGATSDYLSHALLDHIFRATGFASPATLALALCTVAITEADTGSTITEPVGGSYARKATTGWTVLGNSASNTNEEQFADPTGDWGTITATAVLDNTAAGQVLFYDNSPAGDGQNPGISDTVKVPAGQFVVSID